MAYLDVLSLDDTKTYLRIDDTQNETDAEITSMIKSALSYIERTTNVMVFARDKDFDVVHGCVRIYDYPINSTVYPTEDVKTEKKRLYTNYSINSSIDTLTLNVGYSDPLDVPTELVDLAKVMIKVMYYEQEEKQSFKEALPGWATEILNTNRRFVL